jgi:hypothetical protein
MLRTSVLVAGVMGAMAASSEAGVSTGAFAFLSEDANDYDADTGTTAGTYAASVTNTSGAGGGSGSASATLVWGSSSFSFTGSVDGYDNGTDLIYAYSNGVANFHFTTAMYVTMSWDLSNVAGTSPIALAGWSIERISGTPSTVYGIQFEASSTTPTSVSGGISATNIGTGATGQIAAGSYTVATAIQVASPAGSFSVTISFTPVPAPGALPLIAVASLVARRGRRR